MKIGEQKTYNLKKSGDKFTGKVNTLLEQAQCVLYAETANDEVQQFWKFDVSTHSVYICLLQELDVNSSRSSHCFHVFKKNPCRDQ